MTNVNYGTICRVSPLEEFWHNHLINGLPLEKSHRKNVAFQAGSVVVTTIGQCPISRIALKGGNGIRGWLWASSNLIGFSALNIWAVGKVVKKDSLWNSPVRNTFAVIGGIASVIPVAYMAYSENDQSVPDLILALVANAGMPIYSLLLTLSDEEKMEQAKRDLIDQLSQNQDRWIQSIRSNNKNAFLALFQPIEKREESRIMKIGEAVAEGVGSVFASANVLFSGTLGYYAMKWTNSPLAYYGTAILVSGITAKLYFHGTIKVTQRIYQSIFHRSKPSLSFQLKPFLTTALWLTGLLLTSLCYGPSLKVCDDDYSGAVKVGMKICVPVGLYLMVANAVSDLVDDLVLFHIRHWGPEEKKLVVELHERLKYFKSLIQESPDSEFQTLQVTIERSCRQIQNFIPSESHVAVIESNLGTQPS